MMCMFISITVVTVCMLITIITSIIMLLVLSVSLSRGAVVVVHPEAQGLVVILRVCDNNICVYIYIYIYIYVVQQHNNNIITTYIYNIITYTMVQ